MYERLSQSYFERDRSPRHLAMAVVNWVDALADLSQWAVAEACQEWLKDGTHMPSPAHIRKLAMKHLKRADIELASRREAEAYRQADNVVPISTERREALISELTEAGKLSPLIASAIKPGDGA